MKFLSTAVMLTMFSATHLSADGFTETKCPDITDISYDETLALYQARLPETGLTIKSMPNENVGTIERFDSVFLDHINHIFVHCVYRLGNDDPVVLWPSDPIQAEKNDSNLWMPFLNYHYCTESPSMCIFNVQE